MKHTLQTLQKKRKSKKGFTLMEMLIVVAIIAVLVAIAIPTFSSQLDKARLATDQANVRSTYAVMQASKLTGQNPEDGTGLPTSDTKYYMLKNGTFKAGTTAPTNAYRLQSNVSAGEVETVPDFSGNKNNYVIIQYTVSGGTWTVTNANA